jgi:hypothetical protein
VEFFKRHINRFNKPYFQPDFPNKTTLVATCGSPTTNLIKGVLLSKFLGPPYFATKVVLFRKISFAFITLTVNDYAKFKFRTVCKNRILKCDEYNIDIFVSL